MAASRAGLITRIEKLEAVQRTEDQNRWHAALLALRNSMTVEHLELFETWMHQHCGGLLLHLTPGERWYSVLARLQPPALVRAFWLMMHEHTRSGAPVSLPPAVAAVYVADADAFPLAACSQCGYLLPVRGQLRPSGTFKYLGVYGLCCPVCGWDDRADLEGET